jgi:hypothetical protein
MPYLDQTERKSTVDSSRRAALEARSTRGGTRVCRASGVFTEMSLRSNSWSNPHRIGLRPIMVERQSPESLDWGEKLRINELQNLFGRFLLLRHSL